MNKLIEFLIRLFVKEPIQAAVIMVADNKPSEPGRPTRVEVFTYMTHLIETESPYGKAYKMWRETGGKNRSPELDRMIIEMGGHLGDSYCLFGIQSIMRAIEEKFDCIFDLPHTGSTQTFWQKSKEIYKVQTPGPLQVGIYQHGDTWQGHAVLPQGFLFNQKLFKTFEFNTDAHDASKVVRDGQGCGYIVRSMTGSGDMHLKGFVDIYLAIKRKSPGLAA
jgi:hypothetical protein